MSDPRTDFQGAKVLLFAGAQLVVLQRDHTPGIVWPGYLNFPGGGREEGESPEACAIRETYEELGIQLDASDLEVVSTRQSDGNLNWFFAAYVGADVLDRIRFGNEGTGWMAMPPQAFIDHPKAIPHFATLLGTYLNRQKSA